jgi:riboflavin biosynthesis pyrimidine reductase
MLMLNRLRPGPLGEVEAAQVYSYPTGDGRYLRVNMVSSVDGAAVLAGRVGALTGPADQRLLLELRSLCDVLLVGAGTVRAEGYGPIRPVAELVDRRRDEGQLAAPRLAVVSRGIDVDLGSTAFTQAVERPILVTTELADPERVTRARQVADVLVAGERTVDMGLATELLLEQGLRRMLSEGGPHLLAELYAADLVDELCLALSPLVACGEGARLTAGAALPQPHRVHLASVLEGEEFLFLRYTSARWASASVLT